MNTQYDGEWITRDLNESIVLNLVDSNLILYSSYEAIDLINVVGDDVQMKTANVNDLANLLLYGVMRFKCISYPKEYIDIPLKQLYKLFDKANILDVDKAKVELINDKKYLDEIDAFMVSNGEQIKDKRYAFIATIIREPSQELRKLLDYSRDYGKMDMKEKFDALKGVDSFNKDRNEE